MLKIYVVITVVMSIITLVMYGVDKRRDQRNKWRISEFTLIIFSLLGGSIGALIGMKAFHHKTKKLKFEVLIPLTLIIWILLGIVILYIY